MANGRAYQIVDHYHDVVVVGAGGAGLRATLGMAAGVTVLANPGSARATPANDRLVLAMIGVVAAMQFVRMHRGLRADPDAPARGA